MQDGRAAQRWSSFREQTEGFDMAIAASTEIPVWDRIVRIGHWLLAGAFLTAYLTEDDWLTTHVWAGYLAGAVVVLRIVWGFVGSPHARFRDFLFAPAQSLRYLGELLRGRARRYIGHSPAGAVMVFALLIGVALTAGSGLMVYAYDKHAGPLAGVVAGQYKGLAKAERHRAYERAEDFWEETHEVLANLTLFLVVLHIGGVTLASVAHRENLVRAMFTGRKRADDGV
jgi:cytochrome b